MYGGRKVYKLSHAFKSFPLIRIIRQKIRNEFSAEDISMKKIWACIPSKQCPLKVEEEILKYEF